ARSTSEAVAAATWATTSPVAGLIASNVPPSTGSVHWLLIKSRVWRIVGETGRETSVWGMREPRSRRLWSGDRAFACCLPNRRRRTRPPMFGGSSLEYARQGLDLQPPHASPLCQGRPAPSNTSGYDGCLGPPPGIRRCHSDHSSGA